MYESYNIWTYGFRFFEIVLQFKYLYYGLVSKILSKTKNIIYRCLLSSITILNVNNNRYETINYKVT